MKIIILVFLVTYNHVIPSSANLFSGFLGGSNLIEDAKKSKDQIFEWYQPVANVIKSGSENFEQKEECSKITKSLEAARKSVDYQLAALISGSLELCVASQASANQVETVGKVIPNLIKDIPKLFEQIFTKILNLLTSTPSPRIEDLKLLKELALIQQSLRFNENGVPSATADNGNPIVNLPSLTLNTDASQEIAKFKEVMSKKLINEDSIRKLIECFREKEEQSDNLKLKNTLKFIVKKLSEVINGLTEAEFWVDIIVHLSFCDQETITFLVQIGKDCTSRLQEVVAPQPENNDPINTIITETKAINNDNNPNSLH